MLHGRPDYEGAIVLRRSGCNTATDRTVINGIPMPVVSRLLGHSNVPMTLRCAHLADGEFEAAAERIGAAIARILRRE